MVLMDYSVEQIKKKLRNSSGYSLHVAQSTNSSINRSCIINFPRDKSFPRMTSSAVPLKTKNFPFDFANPVKKDSSQLMGFG